MKNEMNDKAIRKENADEISRAVRGGEALKTLAEIYQQLYLVPGEQGESMYRAVVARGEEPPEKSLAHFRTTPEDICEYLRTPAGEVRTITLCDRKDFETCVQLMAHKAKAEPIPATQGAIILLGVINWQKINARKDAFYREAARKGEPEPTEDEWLEERSRFIQVKSNYTDVLIILSRGTYSHVPAEDVGLPEKEWLEKSQTIRQYHECTHFVCRKLYPELVDPIWDEVVADAVGIRAAMGHFDQAMAERCLGIEGEIYIGGRLENYLPEELKDTEEKKENEEKEEKEEKKVWLSRMAGKIHRLMGEIGKISDEVSGEPFELALALEEKKESLWG